jgi:hypothetical protein
MHLDGENVQSQPGHGLFNVSRRENLLVDADLGRGKPMTAATRAMGARDETTEMV